MNIYEEVIDGLEYYTVPHHGYSNHTCRDSTGRLWVFAQNYVNFDAAYEARRLIYSDDGGVNWFDYGTGMGYQRVIGYPTIPCAMAIDSTDKIHLLYWSANWALKTVYRTKDSAGILSAEHVIGTTSGTGTPLDIVVNSRDEIFLRHGTWLTKVEADGTIGANLYYKTAKFPSINMWCGVDDVIHGVKIVSSTGITHVSSDGEEENIMTGMVIGNHCPIIEDSRKGLHACWVAQGVPSTRKHLFYSYKPYGGSWGTPELVCEPTTSVYYNTGYYQFRMSITEDDILSFVWMLHVGDTTEGEVNYRFHIPSGGWSAISSIYLSPTVTNYAILGGILCARYPSSCMPRGNTSNEILYAVIQNKYDAGGGTDRNLNILVENSPVTIPIISSTVTTLPVTGVS